MSHGTLFQIRCNAVPDYLEWRYMIEGTTQVLIVGIFIAYHSARIRLEMASPEMNDTGGLFLFMHRAIIYLKRKKLQNVWRYGKNK